MISSTFVYTSTFVYIRREESLKLAHEVVEWTKSAVVCRQVCNFSAAGTPRLAEFAPIRGRRFANLIVEWKSSKLDHNEALIFSGTLFKNGNVILRKDSRHAAARRISEQGGRFSGQQRREYIRGVNHGAERVSPSPSLCLHHDVFIMIYDCVIQIDATPPELVGRILCAFSNQDAIYPAPKTVEVVKTNQRRLQGS